MQCTSSRIAVGSVPHMLGLYEQRTTAAGVGWPSVGGQRTSAAPMPASQALYVWQAVQPEIKPTSPSVSYPPVLRTGSNSNAHAGYGVGLCTLRGHHVAEACLTRRSTGHPTAGHNGALRQGRAAVGCRLPLR